MSSSCDYGPVQNRNSSLHHSRVLKDWCMTLTKDDLLHHPAAVLMNQPLIVGATVCLVAHGAVLLKDLVGCSVAQSTPSQTPSTAPKAYGDEDEGFDDNEVIQTEQPQEHGYQGLGGLRFGSLMCPDGSWRGFGRVLQASFCCRFTWMRTYFCRLLLVWFPYAFLRSRPWSLKQPDICYRVSQTRNVQIYHIDRDGGWTPASSHRWAFRWWWGWRGAWLGLWTVQELCESSVPILATFSFRSKGNGRAWPPSEAFFSRTQVCLWRDESDEDDEFGPVALAPLPTNFAKRHAGAQRWGCRPRSTPAASESPRAYRQVKTSQWHAVLSGPMEVCVERLRVRQENRP